ncbi:MAG: hypothetical protein EBW87_02075 [Burkholderiaceae bacterium]|nr:hypothetical protein [Burkholderiaceae bacterium]
MPSTKTITVYKYDELSEKAKDNVKYKYIAGNIDLDYVIDDAKREGEKFGFMIDEVLYSGFSNQGDGASWTGTIQLQRFLEHHLKEDNPDYGRYTVLLTLLEDGWAEHSVSVSRKSFMYNHSNTMQIDQQYMGYVATTEDAVIRAACPLQGANVQELYEGILIDSLLDDLYEWALKEARKYADHIYDLLEQAYDDEMSDQHVSLMADANEWEFDETGRLI